MKDRLLEEMANETSEQQAARHQKVNDKRLAALALQRATSTSATAEQASSSKRTTPPIPNEGAQVDCGDWTGQPSSPSSGSNRKASGSLDGPIKLPYRDKGDAVEEEVM